MDYAIARKRMVQDQLLARGIKDEKILEIMLKIPRHRFVEEGLLPMAYKDHPLNIGEAQTISQPYIVAYMTECLEIGPEDRILEIGTGCGYQTAILAELANHVYSVERLSPLFSKARRILRELGYKNIHLRLGDGSAGWAKYAPYDGILVAAAGPVIPQPYLDQLAEGGRLILPVDRDQGQELILARKRGGQILQESLSGVRFVKLKGKYGFQPD